MELPSLLLEVCLARELCSLVGGVSGQGAAFSPVGGVSGQGAAFSPVGGVSGQGAVFSPVGGVSGQGAAFSPVGGVSSQGAAFSPVGGVSGQGAAFSIVNVYCKYNDQTGSLNFILVVETHDRIMCEYNCFIKIYNSDSIVFLIYSQLKVIS